MLTVGIEFTKYNNFIKFLFSRRAKLKFKLGGVEVDFNYFCFSQFLMNDGQYQVMCSVFCSSLVAIGHFRVPVCLFQRDNLVFN